MGILMDKRSYLIQSIGWLICITPEIIYEFKPRLIPSRIVHMISFIGINLVFWFWLFPTNGWFWKALYLAICLFFLHVLIAGKSAC
jgi:hypothetical protein